MSLGPHAVFIWASYGAMLFVISALVVWLVTDGRHLERRLADLEARGVRRRSSRAEDKP